MSTKRITFFIISLYIVISAFAATKDLANDISPDEIRSLVEKES